MNAYILAYTIRDRQGRVLVSAVGYVESKEQADDIVARAVENLANCEGILEKYTLTENTCPVKN